jgi:hypothetical protein
MPHKIWKHQCNKYEATVWIRTEVCSYCEKRGAYDGWGYTHIEAMFAYQQRTGLKPIGPHRQLADKLLDPRMKICEQCKGRGLLDINQGERWEMCPRCKFAGYVFDGSAEELEALRQQVISAFPDVAVERQEVFK